MVWQRRTEIIQKKIQKIPAVGQRYAHKKKEKNLAARGLKVMAAALIPELNFCFEVVLGL